MARSASSRTSPETAGADAARLVAIEKALRRRQVWLEHMARGDASVREVAWQDLGDDGRRENAIRQSYSGRYPIELLQNGHDACADGQIVGKVWFVLTDSALLVGNEGVAFEPSRITSLTRLGSSSKAGQRFTHHQIGYKGIGFTAAFEITDTPQIISSPASFYFDRSRARREVIASIGRPNGTEPVPARCFPFPLEHTDWAVDEAEVQHLRSDGAVTVIRLPLRRGRSREQVEADLLKSLPAEVLLFMPAVATLEIRSESGNETWTRREGRGIGRGRLVHLVSSSGDQRSWLTSAATVAVPPEETAALDDDLWKGVRRLNAAVAIPWSRNGPLVDAAPQRLHAYFPTDDRLGRALLVHGDFYLDDSRRHVEWLNAQGAISRRVAEAVSRLTANLVESVAEYGQRLLACLAPIGPADGFGEEIGTMIEVRLRDARIANTADGSRTRTPTEVSRLDSGLDVAWERKAVAAMAKSGDILRPGDDVGPAGTLLKALGCLAIAPAELAARFDPARSPLSYDQALTLIERWLVTLGNAPLQAAVTSLRGRSVVQDQSRRWRRPDDVEQRATNAPALPARLRRPELLQPIAPAARAFVRRMRVPTLDAATALDRLLQAVSSGAIGSSDSEREQVLGFVVDLWRDHRGVFGPRSSRLGAVPVPVRTFRGQRRSWRRADATYFSAPWTGTRTIEDLYGPLGLAEFLAVGPSDNPPARASLRDLFATLGVADRPRSFPVDESRCDQYKQWQALAPVIKASRCVENRHEYSGLRIDGTVVDRLDDLLERASNPERGLALGHGLLMLDEPYGPEVAIRCDNNEHHGHALARKAIGYQRWRLEANPWVPVRGDPSGIEVQIPARAWTDIPRTSDWLVVPRAQLRPEDGRRLGLVRAEQPRPDSVVAALEALEDSHPDLAAAPAVIRDSAVWLMTRLERVLRRVDQPSVKAPPFPTELDGVLAWSRTPLIANVPGLPRLPGVSMLPTGRWTNLARAFGLKRASESVTAEIRAGPVRHVDRILPVMRRAQLLALLVNGDSNDVQTAARIAGLREIGVSFLNIRWSVDGVAAEPVEATSHLALRRDRRGRPIAASLYHDARRARDPFVIGRALSDYLDLPDLEDAAVLFLNDPDEMVLQRGISRSQVDEAMAMLRRRRGFADDPEPPPSPPDPAAGSAPAGGPKPADPNPTGDKGPAPSGQPAGRKLLEADRVTFGASRKAKAPKTRPTKRSGGSGSRRPKSKAPEMVPPGSAATPDPEAERRAVEVVTRFGYEVRGAVEVRDVQSLNKGWDLEFHFADKSWEPVEVKGSLGHAPFIITPNEWSAAKRYRNFVLYQVVGIANPSTARMRCFRGLGDRLAATHVKSMSWMVTGWPELDPEEIPLSMDEG